jgi:nucleotide-binding universal stress UspA family protein
MLTIKTILHPSDFSERSVFAFRLACSLAHSYGARLIVLHVAEPPIAAAGEGALILLPDVDLVAIRKRLQQLLPEDPDITIEHQLVEGEAGREILAAAERSKCDVIVMGTHGRTGLSRLLMGSVSERVVRNAACPVLTVKSPKAASAYSEDPNAATAGKAAVAMPSRL